jgi:probable DNA metabolism protein
MNSTPRNFIEILERHSDCSNIILDKAATIDPDTMEFSADPETIRIRKMVNSVLAENHMMKAFARLKPLGEKVLFAYLKPQHDIWTMAGAFFARRFPGTIIVLGNASESWAFILDGRKVRHCRGESLNRMLRELEVELGKGASSSSEDLWDTYYWSQYRPEAKNTPYFRHNMPEKYVRRAGIRAETDSGGRTLDDFG